MIKTLSKYRNNKKLGKTSCEQVLGEENNLFDFWKFVKNNKDNMDLVHSVLLLKFCESNNFEKDQLAFYKQGLNDFYNFFIQCYNELENKKTEKEMDAKLKQEREIEVIMP